MKFSGWEKVGFGCLVAAWTVWGSNQIGNALVTPEMPGENMGYKVEVPETVAVAAAPVEEAVAVDIIPLLASADPAAGAKVFRKCAACHTAAAGAGHKQGPNLWNVVGRDKGSIGDFAYSSTLAEMAGNWGYKELNGFIENAKGYAPGTKMNFKLKKPSDRANVLAYIQTLSDSPVPFPSE